MVCIDSKKYYDMLVSAAARVEASAQSINDLNVFPVPDGDTGTNMGMTIAGVRGVVFDESASLGATAKALADAMLRNARGNSGVILSVFFKNMAKALKDSETADISAFASAMASGVEGAYGAVMNPTEGTILTVMRVAAEKATELAASQPMGDGEFFDSIVLAASEALEKTPEQLPLLKQAGVVDAGGFGFVTILKAMAAYVKGEPCDVYVAFQASNKPVSAAAAADFDVRFPFCTECIIDKNDEYKGEDKLAELKSFILAAGDSAVFVEDEEIVKIHVHTDNSIRVLGEAAKYGTLVTAKVENMRVQHNSLMVDQPEKAYSEPKEYGFAAVSNGDGICNILKDLGTDEIIFGGQTMNPSTEQILDAVNRINAKTVFVFPNNSNIKMAAQQAAELANEAGGKKVVVIPTISIQQGISAMYSFDESADAASNAEAMTEALSSVRTMSVTTAVRDASIDGLEIKSGQYLGLIENKVKKVSESMAECLIALAGELKGVSCVTIFYGEDVSSEEAEHLSAVVENKLGKNTDVVLLYGGQPVYPLLISGDN